MTGKCIIAYQIYMYPFGLGMYICKQNTEMEKYLWNLSVKGMNAGVIKMQCGYILRQIRECAENNTYKVVAFAG